MPSATQRGSWLARPPSPSPENRPPKHAVVYFGYALLAISFLVLVAAAVIPIHVSPTTRSTHDLAAFENGGRIIDAYTSISKDTPIRDLYTTTVAHDRFAYLLGQSKGPASRPENALGVVPDSRALWFFPGTRGTIGIHLSTPTAIAVVELKGHPVKRSCLPRDFNVWGLALPEEIDVNLPWEPLPEELNFTVTVKVPRPYNIFAPARNTPTWIPLGHVRDAPRGRKGHDFRPPSAYLQAKNAPVHVLAIEFVRNWGESYSCFPGLSVYARP